MAEFKDYEIVSADNDAAPPGGAPEEMDRADANDVMREMMGAMARDTRGVATGGGAWRDPNEGNTITRVSDTEISIAVVDVTLQFVANRKVRIDYATGNNGYAFVTSSSFSGGSTNVILEDFDGAGADSVVRSGVVINEVTFSSLFGDSTDGQAGRQAYEDEESAFVVPSALTSTAIAAALTSASSSGKTVLLQKGTYDITSVISVPDNAHILGLGVGVSILMPKTDLNDAVFELVDSASDVSFENFEIDGNAANQTTAGIAIESGEANVRILMRDLYIHDIYAGGIQFAPSVTSVKGLTIEECVFEDTGGDAIRIENPDSVGSDVFMSNVSIVDYGVGGAALLTADGISSAINLGMIGCRITVNSNFHTGAGIHCRSAGGDHLTDVDITGSLAAASTTYGLIIEGDKCDILGCSFSLAEGSGTAVPFELRGDHNSLYNSSINDGSSCSITGDHNHISNCHILDTGSISEDVAAINNIIHACVFDNMPDKCVELAGTDSIVRGCTFTSWAVVTSSSYAVTLSGARNIEYGNLYQGHTATAPDVSATGTFPGTGAFFHDAIASTQNLPLSPGVAIEGDSGTLEGVNWPLPPNGKRRFVIDAYVSIDFAGSNTVGLAVRNGTIGNISDAIMIPAQAIYSKAGGAGYGTLILGACIVTPAVNTTFTVAAFSTADSVDDVRPNNWNVAVFDSNAAFPSYVTVRYLDG